MDDWIIKLISQTGFPIAITCYVLIRLEKALTAMTKQMFKLTLVLARKGISLDEDEDGEE